MKKLYLLSPSDRFNYGDMLFPYILKHYLGDAVDEVVNCAITISDLSVRGGLPTYGVEKLYEASPDDENFLIVAGGECLFSTWSTIMSFIYSSVDKARTRIAALPNIPKLKRIANALFDCYVRHKYKIRTSYPFTIQLDELPYFKAVMYNSVGAATLYENRKLVNSKKCKAILESSAYVSVRDKGAKRGLEMMGVKHSLIPDSAILMSEVFSDKFLQSGMSLANMPFKKKSYIFF